MLAAPPEPLTRAERKTVWITALVVALTRWFALSKTLWDWDEALFGLALLDYDVAAYHPHPPGFPLFVALAKLIPADAFHAVQSIAFIASLFVFPAAFFLARELRANTFVAVAAGLVLAFSPNVWFYGGTALSDVPSMVLSLCACALLLRGCRDPRALLAGAIVLGIAAGVRPQNLLIGFVPLLVAFLCRRRTALIGALIAAAIVLVSYGIAAAASGGWSVYAETLAHHEQYIRKTDSFLSPIRPSLLRVVDDFFFWPYRAPAINIAIVVLALIALVRRRAHTFAALAIFGPFCLFAWLYLDFHSASRFSIAYMPLFAILAAEGIDATRQARLAILAALVALMIGWTWPGLWIAHTTPSPPAAAIDVIRASDPASTIVYVDERVAPHAALLLHDYERRETKTLTAPGVMHERGRVFLLREGGGQFTREPVPLASIVRPRYFEASAIPARRVTFGDGWYGEEGPPRAPFRWMGERAYLLLPPGEKLTLRLAVPVDSEVIISMDGRLLDIIAAKRGTLERTWDIRFGHQLVIQTSRTVRADGDPRALGLRLDGLEIR